MSYSNFLLSRYMRFGKSPIIYWITPFSSENGLKITFKSFREVFTAKALISSKDSILL